MEVYYRQKIFDFKGIVFSIEPRFKAPGINKDNFMGRELFNYQRGTDFETKGSLGFSLYDVNTGIPGVSKADGFFLYLSAAY